MSAQTTQQPKPEALRRRYGLWTCVLQAPDGTEHEGGGLTPHEAGRKAALRAERHCAALERAMEQACGEAVR